MLRKYNKREAMVNSGGGYSQGTTSYGHYSNHYHNQSYQSYIGYERSGTPPPRNSSPIINYPATYPQLQTKDVVCGFCKHRFYIGKDLKAAYSPLLLPCGHATCSTCESSKPGRACPQCPDFPIDVEARKRLPCNLYVIGLVHAIVATPMHIDDPDMNFHVPLNAIARQNFEQGSCSECGMVAYYDCKQCEVRYCKLCFKKMHRKALQSHKPIPLNKNAFDFTISTFCPNHETEATEYYCNECNFEGCSHCIIKFHRDHDTEPHIDRNKEWILQFRAAFAKLQDTRMRIHQTQQIDKTKFDAIKKSRSVNTNMQSKRFGKSLIVPPIPLVQLVSFILTEKRINKSCVKKSELMNKFKRKHNLPIRLGTTSIIMPPTTIPQTTTTTLRPTTMTQPVITTTSEPLTTTTPKPDSGVMKKLVAGIFAAGTVISALFTFLYQLMNIVPGILTITPSDIGDDGSGEEDDDDEDCDKLTDEILKEECEEKKKERQPCIIKIQEISDNYPLIIQHTDLSKFMYPQSRGKIVLQPDDKITFGCNSADTYFCKNKTIIENVVTHAERYISSMNCAFSTINSKIKFLQGYIGKKSQYQKFQIGLSYGSNFVPKITGYYDLALQSTDFVRSTLSSALGYKQKEPPQLELRQDLLEWSPDVYSLSRQQDTFSQLLFCHGNSSLEGDCTYVNKDSYLEPALLTPASHFVYTRAAETAYYYMNSAPMWNTIKYGNWDKIEKHVQRMASRLKMDLIVITGVYGQLRLPDYGGLYEDIYMKTDPEECSKSIVVPQYFWKLVYDPVNKNGKPSGIVYVTVNNPFMDSKKYYKICQNPGQSVDGESPAGWYPNLFQSGFSYVCAVDDFILTTGLDLVDRLS